MKSVSGGKRKMYRIGICDDEIGICNQLEGFIEKYMKKRYISGEIEIFYTGETLCQYLKSHENINLIFLDIELPQINGVQVGGYLRNVLKDEVTDIIYISSKTSYALELFQCRPLDFIIKPLSYEKIERVLDIVMTRNGIKSKNFEFQIGGIVQKIALQQIAYFKSDNKKIHIMMCSGDEKVFNGKLSEVANKVPDSVFLQIHKSYLINYDYVSEYSNDWVRMINGDILSISKVNRKNVKIALIQHEMQ